MTICCIFELLQLTPRRTEYQEMATSVKSADAEERRQKSLVIILFSIVFVGLGYVIYDYFRIVNIQHLPENLTGMDQIVASWKTEGFVRSFDSSKAVLSRHFWLTCRFGSGYYSTRVCRRSRGCVSVRGDRFAGVCAISQHAAANRPFSSGRHDFLRRIHNARLA